MGSASSLLRTARVVARHPLLELRRVVRDLPPRSLGFHEHVERRLHAWIIVEQSGKNDVDLTVNGL
jgi:hypothetical protein